MKVDVKVPSPGESITEVQIARWLKKDGDYVEKDEEICEIDSDKATLAVSAGQSGILHILIQEGETVKVGDVICNIDTSAEPPPEREKKHTEKAVAFSSHVIASATGKSFAAGTPSPSAAKLMREHGIPGKAVDGTGRGGRIIKEDVAKALKPQTTVDTPPPAGQRNEERKKMSTLRKKLSQRLVAVKNQTAMLTTFNEVDMSVVIQIRKKFKDAFEKKHGVGLGFMSFFTRAVCVALKEFSAVNAMIDNDEVVYHNYMDIGIAVSAPKGLMVPVLRNAEKMAFPQIENEIKRLAEKARNGTITIDEMTGGTFTITNGGVFGSMLSTPILNPPQSAILGMHNIVERPVAVSGKVEIRPIMYIALSYDHRIIDGRESVGFLVRVKEFIENPMKTAEGEKLKPEILLEI